VEFVAKPFANKAGDVSIINSYSKFTPQDKKTDDLVSLCSELFVGRAGQTVKRVARAAIRKAKGD